MAEPKFDGPVGSSWSYEDGVLHFTCWCAASTRGDG
jgi:NAD-dependent DNA ligase